MGFLGRAPNRRTGRAAIVVVPEPLDVHACMPSLVRMFGPQYATDDHQALFERVRSYRRLGRLSKHVGVPIAIHFVNEFSRVTLEDGRTFVARNDGRWQRVEEVSDVA